MLHELLVHNGDAPGYGGFIQQDVDFFNSQKGIDKIHRQLSKLPWDFNIYVLMSVKGRNSPSIDLHKDDNLAKYIGRDVITKDRITLYFTNNVTNKTNYRPMNAWILMHRIAHSLYVKRDNQPDLIPCMEYTDVTYELLSKLRQLIYDVHMPLMSDMYNFGGSNDQRFVEISNQLLTMRSAREGKIRLILDVDAELMSQYLFSTIKLNPIENWDISKLTPFRLGGWDKSQYKRLSDKPVTLDNLNVNLINETIAIYESKLNIACKRSMDAMVGKIVGW